MTSLMLAATVLSGGLLQVREKVERYLTEEEALRVLFGDAAVTCHELRLDEGAREAASKRLGRPVEERVTVFAARRDGKRLGFAVIAEEVGKYLPITFIVGADPSGKLLDVAVMVHREPIGQDCKRRDFLDQFKGKNLDDPLRKDKDLLTVAGATLSCNGVARGTRRVLAVLDAAGLFAPGGADRLLQEDVREQRMRMGTLCTITARGPDARKGIAAAFDEISRWDSILSDWNPESELSKLNDAGGGEPSEDLRAFLDAALRHARDLRGAFDPTVGAAVRAWGFRDGALRIPSDDELKSLPVGWERVRRDNGRIVLPDGLRLDPGAIGKGWAVDKAVEVLRKAGIPEALVDFGSSVYGYGRDWKVAVRDPHGGESPVAVVVLNGGALGVSGNYEKFFEKDGRRYGHVIDPRTRRPVDGVAGTAVLAATATEADVDSTAVFVDESLMEGRAALRVPSDPKTPPRATDAWQARAGGK